MFKEKYLINKSAGELDDVVKALSPDKTRAETYQEVLHNNSNTSTWNSDKIAKAQEISIKIRDQLNDVRSKIKKVFWDLPKEAGKTLASSLSQTALMFPAWLWAKTAQPAINLAKLITSGAVVATAETIETVLDAPSRIMVRTNNRIQDALGTGGGGGGHGMPAPAHGH